MVTFATSILLVLAISTSTVYPFLEDRNEAIQEIVKNLPGVYKVKEVKNDYVVKIYSNLWGVKIKTKQNIYSLFQIFHNEEHGELYHFTNGSIPITYSLEVITTARERALVWVPHIQSIGITGLTGFPLKMQKEFELSDKAKRAISVAEAKISVYLRKIYIEPQIQTQKTFFYSVNDHKLIAEINFPNWEGYIVNLDEKLRKGVFRFTQFVIRHNKTFGHLLLQTKTGTISVLEAQDRIEEEEVIDYFVSRNELLWKPCLDGRFSVQGWRMTKISERDMTKLQKWQINRALHVIKDRASSET